MAYEVMINPAKPSPADYELSQSGRGPKHYLRAVRDHVDMWNVALSAAESTVNLGLHNVADGMAVELMKAYVDYDKKPTSHNRAQVLFSLALSFLLSDAISAIDEAAPEGAETGMGDGIGHGRADFVPYTHPERGPVIYALPEVVDATLRPMRGSAPTVWYKDEEIGLYVRRETVVDAPPDVTDRLEERGIDVDFTTLQGMFPTLKAQALRPSPPTIGNVN